MQWDAVPVLDAGGLKAFRRFIDEAGVDTHIVVTDIPFQPLKTLARARIVLVENKISFYPSVSKALIELGLMDGVTSEA